ncbi:MATE family efflux transporter [Lentilitoribacter sp. EG35]|uniref:MATE family efflux transporter n=1 Tax=Lentilitoribacter sp. EG35 TaxID=3234192 RepID=UPI0034611A91
MVSEKTDVVEAQPKFVTGSTMRHVMTMTATGSIGLVAIFLVDAFNLFYISLLGEDELAAAIGYAGTLLFFTMSLNIGLSIAATALTSRALGSGDKAEARNLAGASLFYMFALSAIVVALAYPFIDDLLAWIGATGNTAVLAQGYMEIVILSLPVLGLGMCCASLLRAVGDAKSAMYVTLGAGFLTAILDPLFIFGFDMGINGAATATVISRFFMVGFGFYVLIRTHDLIAFPTLQTIIREIKPFMIIGGPAILTQLATPIGNTYMTATVAEYGDSAVAGWAVVGRIIPVAFGALFALSGAIGPILGQNLGARKFHRIEDAIKDSFIFTAVYVIVVSAILALAVEPIADVFGATGQARDVITFFCLWIAISFLFNGMLFSANAAFNNLGFALYSTLFNWGRSTLGVIPFVWIGSQYYGINGALAGYGLGAVFFGIASAVVCLRVVKKLAEKADHEDQDGLHYPPAAQSPFTSGKASAL